MRSIFSQHPARTLITASLLLITAGTHAENTTTTAIDGVVAQGTQIEFIRDKFEGTEGPISLPDGSLIFTETRANRVTRIAEDNSISTYFDNSNGTNGLAFTKKGELVSVQNLKPQVGIVYPKASEKVWVDNYQGKPFQRPNDLVIDKSGGVYFTDIGVQPKGENTEPARPAVYYAKADGKITQVLNDVERPNGVQLSRDEKTLYVANTAGEYILAYPILGNGKLGARKDYAKLAGYEKGENGFSSGADGLAIDNEGRLYVASNKGIEIFDATGNALGVIAIPQKPQNLAFAGKDKKTLYVVGRGAAYKIAVLTPGFKGRVK
ncbi:gluconolactonase [Cellvibrio zantedeschiae]|uniref:Gluconolactonase n=1 Tax=Cellvibrio zantedeschiae TaxID=1237077 RepID=A0ABQ3B248_9GAMM|nr:SMP-30/gluconolactonase/LRE family protein [Cellvibrio zantedeschiae]GGY71692.1 gluconolactonase [Cellvibrio zantedeschiae]